MKPKIKAGLVILFLSVIFIIMLSSPVWIAFFRDGHMGLSFEQCFKINSIDEKYVDHPLEDDILQYAHYEYTVKLTALREINRSEILINGVNSTWIGDMYAGEVKVIEAQCKDRAESISAMCEEMISPLDVSFQPYY